MWRSKYKLAELSFRPLTRISLLVTTGFGRGESLLSSKFQTVDTDFSPGDDAVWSNIDEVTPNCFRPLTRISLLVTPQPRQQLARPRSQVSDR